MDPRKNIVPTFRPLLVALFGAVLLTGCLANDVNFERLKQDVNSVAVGSPIEVDAMTLAKVMLRAGFSSERILEVGPSVRRSLAGTGGAEIRKKGRIQALFSHMDGRLYVTSSTSGTFSVQL